MGWTRPSSFENLKTEEEEEGDDGGGPKMKNDIGHRAGRRSEGENQPGFVARQRD